MKNILKEKLKYIILLIIVIVIIINYFYFSKESKAPAYTAKELKSIEIRKYEGENLSSINDFRENSIKGPQYADRDKYLLEITGLNKNISYKYNEIINNFQPYTKVIELDCVEGWSVNILWEGALIKDLIDVKEIPKDVTTVIFYAADGYSTSFPLSYILDKNLILAYKMNGVEIPPERGFPFQLVAESKYGYKWIKWVTKIEFSNDPSYKGYWESRGYSNEGNLDESFFAK